MTTTRPDKALVIMPYGHGDRLLERTYILEFLRIKYVIETKTSIRPLSVTSFNADVGEIPRDAVDAILNADVVIALITEKNVNVIYELALRNVLRTEFIIVIKGDPEDVLPIYIRNIGYITWAAQNRVEGKVTPTPEAKNLQDAIDYIAEHGEGFDFETDVAHIPKELTDAIDKNDKDHFIPKMQKALATTFAYPPPKPLDFLQAHIAGMDPGRLLDVWETFQPISLVRIFWEKKENPLQYKQEDMIGSPIVVDANDDYCSIFCISRDAIPETNPDLPPLTIQILMQQIDPYVDKADMESFLADQTEGNKAIILRGESHWAAKVPLRLGANHPNCAEQSFTPVLLAKRVVGDVSHRHTMFLIVGMLRRDMEPRKG